MTDGEDNDCQCKAYAVVDRNTKQPLYVGETCRDLDRRIKEHQHGGKLPKNVDVIPFCAPTKESAVRIEDVLICLLCPPLNKRGKVRCGCEKE